MEEPVVDLLLEAACIPWLAALLSMFRASNVASSHLSLALTLVSIATSPPLTLLRPSFPCKDAYDGVRAHPDNPGQSPRSKILDLITSAVSFLPLKEAYSQGPRLRMWPSLGGQYSANHAY